MSSEKGKCMLERGVSVPKAGSLLWGHFSPMYVYILSIVAALLAIVYWRAKSVKHAPGPKGLPFFGVLFSIVPDRFVVYAEEV